MTRRLPRHFVGRLITALAVAMAPTLVWGQASGSLETGTLRGVRPAGGFGTNRKDVRSITRTFGACSVARGRASVEKWLALPIGSAIANRLAGRVIVDDCLGAGELTIPNDLIRGALFEQLYLTDFGRMAALDFSQIPTIDYRAGYAAGIPAAAANSIALAEFGDCVSRRDGADVRALMMTGPGTPGEVEAFNRLRLHLGPCVPAGQSVQFSRSMLRAGLSEGIYRLSRTAMGRPWGVTS